MIHQLSNSSPAERAPSLRARRAWRSLGVLVLAVVLLAMLLGMTASRRAGMDESHGAITFAGPSFVHHDLSEDDPPREPTHRESPAKKPRLKTLLVQILPTVDPTKPLAFHLRSGEATPSLHLIPVCAEFEPDLHREDPVLRLHPGQAPPNYVA